MVEVLTWLKTSEAASVLGIPIRTMRYKVRTGEFKAKIDSNARSSGGGTCYLVALDSLPLEAQQRYLQKLISSSGESESHAGGKTQEEATPPPPAPAEKIKSIAELVAKYGQEKADKILAQAREKWEAVVKEALAVEGDNDRTRKREGIAKKRKVSLRTLYRKMEAYQKEGILGLVNDNYRTPGDGLEEKKRRAVRPEQVKFIKALALKWPPPEGTFIYEELEKVSIKKGWSMPSQQTVYRVIKDIRHTQKVMAQEGEKAYEAKCMPKVKRDYGQLLPMQEIVGDGHDFDIIISHEGRMVRPQLSAWEDLHSRKIVGWCITLQANSESIGMALYHAITTHGLPGALYTDNGKDYLSHYIEDICERMDIGIRNCIPKTPRSKMIESLFKTVCLKFSKRQPGYCSGDPKKRPPDYHKQLKKLHKEGKLLTLEELVRLFAEWVEWYNNVHIHSELRDTPANVFANTEHFRPGKVNPDEIAVLMMKRERVKVHDGYIVLFGREYWSHNVDLGRIVGEYVQVWYDFQNMGEVLVWYRGKCIGTAVNRKALLHGEDRVALAREMKEARRAKKAVKQDIAGYADGIEDILPEDIVKKARRTKRYHTGADVTPEEKQEAKQAGAKVRRLTGSEGSAREALEVLEKSRAAGYPDTEPRKIGRAQELLMKKGAAVLAAGKK